MASVALQIARDGDLLASIYYGLISGYTAKVAAYPGERELDK